MFNENYPPISFIDNTTADEVVESMISDYKSKYTEITGKEASLPQASPYRLIMYAAAMQIYQGMQYADHAAKMSFLTYSEGDFLDHLSALRGVDRILATPASCTMRFSIPSAMSSVIAIPEGTRVTNGNDVFFETDEYVEIAIGQTSVTVSATCTEDGSFGNGIAIGAVNTLVTTLPYITTVENTTATSGGSDLEDDDDFKYRIHDAPGSYSTAGPTGAYIYHTKSASSSIGDVYVETDEDDPAGEVNIYFIMEDGSLPDATMISRVEAELNTRTSRPLTDKITVSAPSVSSYDVTFTYYIAYSRRSEVATIQEEIQNAVAAYNTWQSEKIGRDINPSYLIQKVMAAGAKRVTVTAPTYTVVNESTVSMVDNITITYGGIEDD